MKTQKKLFLRYVFLCLMALCLPAQAETVTWFHNDVSGTPLMATDAYGNVLWKENYRPYGERVSNSAAGADNSLWFAGKPFEQATGLSYMGARYYSPVLGRFMSFDPKGTDPEDIQGLNGYVYANNNPYRFVDPDGHSPLDVIFLAYDLGKLGVAVYNGTGVGTAAVDVALSAVGVVSPVPGVGEALKGARVAAHGADAVRGVEKATEVSAGLVNGAMARGKVSEARVLDDFGLSKNTQKVTAAEGSSIPDAMTSARSIEIKDCISVTCTKQIRIQTDAARSSGRESVLVTGEKTHISSPAKEAFDRIIRRSDLGPQK